jgi:predicted nucleotidyltransferase
MNENESKITTTVRNLVHSIDPDAVVILYGSYARGEAGPDSDWDILVITEKKLTWIEEQELRSLIYKYEVISDTILSLVIHSKKEWSDPVFKITPFYKNIIQEGIRL